MSAKQASAKAAAHAMDLDDTGDGASESKEGDYGGLAIGSEKAQWARAFQERMVRRRLEVGCGV